MKYIIQESRLKNLVVDKIGLDLTNKISIIRHPNELPIHWDNNFFSPQQMNRILNNRGPLYLVEYGKKEYLLIPRDAEKEGKGWWVLDQDGDLFHEYKFMKKLGIDIIGLGFDNLLDMFFDENETINESQADYEERWDKFESFMRRRHRVILNLIDRNINDLTEYGDSYPFTVGAVLTWTKDDIVNDNNIDLDSEICDWIYLYLEDHYTDITKEKMEKHKKK